MKTLALALIAVLCACAAGAAIPQTMSYQGVLRDAVGNVVADGSYGLTFAIYDTSSGGTPLWSESQGLTVAGGIVNAILGSVVPLELQFDTTYWLGISVEGEAELSPRTELTAAPYAQRAAYADVADDGDWSEDSGNLYRASGNVGIGLTDPIATLDVAGTVRTTGLQLTTAPVTGHVLTSDETGLASWQPLDPLTLPYSGVVSDSAEAFFVTNMGTGTAVRGHAGGTGEAAFFSIGNPGSGAAVLHTYTDGTGPALHAHASGGGHAGVFDGNVFVAGGAVGIGVPNPAAGLEIDGPAKMTGFQLTAAPEDGYVLMSDATGMGSWQEAPGTVGGSGTSDYVPKFIGTNTIGNSAIYESSGRVAIGTTTTDAMLRIDTATPIPSVAIRDTSTAASGHNLMDLTRTEVLNSSNGFIAMTAPEGSATNFPFISCRLTGDLGSSTPFHVAGDGSISSLGSIMLTTDHSEAVHATTIVEADHGAGVKGYFRGGAYDGVGVYGEAATDDYYGTGGKFEGGYMGAHGLVEPTGSQSYYGLYGRCDGGSGMNFGVFGDAVGGSTNCGVYGMASGGTNDWAGYFDGDVRVTGTFTNPGPVLEIDHPLDPADEYLRHLAVHSSEMKNVYDGVIALDSSGEAWVELPAWCEALNTDFRYQLTAIGAPGPSLYIADEVEGNRFRIGGGEPGMRVSWMLTGVRNDAHAEANRVSVEEEKRPEDRGKYLHPVAHGAPPAMAIGPRAEDKEKMRP